MNISASESTPLLTASRISVRYAETPALDGVSLAVQPGESVAIMGPSGSGKTSLLHVLAGIITPTSGEVTVATGPIPVNVSALGEAERSRLRREEFGFVFQQGLLIPELTVVENAALPLLLAGQPRAAAEAQATSWLAALGLAGLERRRIGELSGGQAQRVAIARAQVTGATIVFADEPTGALDSVTSFEVMTALLGVAADGSRALVVVTHDEQVAARCSRIIRLRDGRIEHVSDASAVTTDAAARS
ncbi:putative ABC transport system ATP-binding protein [Homoserinimonas aerilata]|uniref:Putative ABC transport system ATP-binding protein n=1 Tax=Homoserinimonas aerilata TaxID=1162970 RepID=A0A542YJS4_9MICO|nr:ABC transporter ATP-binding protein [Homoserinimonas aerilata]TQL48332.1 putative ABC transport system ATP-binding protein [Homoserinimonas aerilata]